MKLKIDTKLFLNTILLALVLIVLFLSISSSKNDGPTTDEPAHIAAGMVKIEHGYFDFFIEQPALINSLSVIPLLLNNYSIDFKETPFQNHWAVGEKFLYHQGLDLDKILVSARLPIILMFIGLCLSIYFVIYKLTKSQLFGIFGFILTAFCPNLIALGRLANVDMGSTFLIFLSSILFINFLFHQNNKNLIITGVISGLALMSKISALIILPYFVILALFYILFYKKKDIKKFFSSIFLIIAIALLMIILVYSFEMKSGYLNQKYDSSNIQTRIYASTVEYGKEIQKIYKWTTQPYDQPQFLLGNFSYSGWWYYYPVAFFYKTTIPVLILFLISVYFFILGIYKKQMQSQRLFYSTSALIFVIFYLIIASTSKLNIGLRYILPVYPFIYLFITLIVYEKFNNKLLGGKIILIILFLMIPWHIFSSIKIYPFYLAYFNEFIGNQKNADKYLIDSNLDWGQDGKRLAQWIEQNKIDQIYTDGVNNYYLKNKAIGINSQDATKSGYYAIGRHKYRLSTFYNQSSSWEQFAKNSQLITIIGNSIYIFKK